ncbi:tetratricopeptide repeat-containing sulfotransferase family protein [Microbulbifer sp. ARAS458-1]|uniref:tetratricopeptide repeat-containing sulfotransferase family protein n=1 Tax=Microbulbifer sp. ARAS458-1 TaxID=3140242 RepID=UPI003877F02E
MNMVEQSCRKARNLLAKGELRESLGCIKTLLQANPDIADGWLVLSEIHAANSNCHAALMACEKAIAIDPESPEILLQFCRCALPLGGKAEKIRVYLDQMLDMSIDNAYQLNEIGRLYTSLDQHELAKRLYQRAIGLVSEEPDFFYNLATAQRFLGEIEGAEEAASRAIELNPKDSEAHLLRSGLRRQTAESNHITSLKASLAASGLSARDRVNLQYALAKELEDLECWDEAFYNLQIGADLRRAHIRYDVQYDLDIMRSLRKTFDADFFKKNRKTAESQEPIFVLGMPRTGSTLLERILSSHSEVQTAGELNNFSQELMRAVKSSGTNGGVDKLSLIESSRYIDFRELGDGYIESTRMLTGKKPHFIDKLPFNYLYIGIIHAALPNARIIHVHRDPMDTCYAVYKQLFQSAYPFSYNLQELGQYYIAYRRLMDHWEAVLPKGRIFHVQYESLVESTETVVRGVLDYCDLDWQVQCLDFHNIRQASTTASATQVRQPIYASSIGKWKNYRAQLLTLQQVLSEGGVLM